MNKQVNYIIKELEAINAYVVLAPEEKYGNSTLLPFTMATAGSDATYYRKRIVDLFSKLNVKNSVIIEWLEEINTVIADEPETPAEYIEALKELNAEL